MCENFVIATRAVSNQPTPTTLHRVYFCPPRGVPEISFAIPSSSFQPAHLATMLFRADMVAFLFMTLTPGALAFVGGGTLRVRSVRPMMQPAPQMAVGDFSAITDSAISQVELPAALLAKSNADILLDEVEAHIEPPRPMLTLNSPLPNQANVERPEVLAT